MTKHIDNNFGRTLCGRRIHIPNPKYPFQGRPNGTVEEDDLIGVWSVKDSNICKACAKAQPNFVRDMLSPSAEMVCHCLELIEITDDRHSYKLDDLTYQFTHIREGNDRCEAPHEDWIEHFHEVYAHVLELRKS